ncbi:MAG: SpoIIE family protein phosphatase [Chlorobiaceae bacterium]|nr:SpoIIE family protein phosphatase [Chlorobiaceae bacterium]
MRASKSIVIKLIIVIMLSCTVIFSITLSYNYYQSRVILERELESNARNLALSLVNRVEAELLSVSKVADGMSRMLEICRYDEQVLHSLLKTTVDENPSIYGSSISFDPFAFDKSRRLFAPYYFRENGITQFKPLDKSYKYLEYLYWDWFQIPRELGRSEWSEPYFDEGGGETLMATYSVPFYEIQDGKKRFKGIVSADMGLESLTKLISSVKILNSGYAALYSRTGMVLAHPLKNVIMNETIFNIAEERKEPLIREFGKKMIAGESGFVHFYNLGGIKSWMYYAPIRSTGWTLIVVFPESELLENVRTLSLTMAAIGVTGIILLTLTVAFIAHSITKPLRQLAAATQVVASGNFEVALPDVHTQDEVGILTNAFQMMTKSLKDYIRNLTETTAAKERIQSELKVAGDIQLSLLPRIFPPFPDHKDFDIFALMDPAKEVGGDFYDFFFIDRDKLCFLIADVSDKGVPAALYMMVTKTLLKSEGQRLGDPDIILSSVNNILAVDDDSCMFATVFLAVLDLKNGEVRFANAGHNPPLLVKEHEVKCLSLHTGFVIGPMPDSCYKTEKITLSPGDILFLYTDGITEAKNHEEMLFGEKRLIESLNKTPTDSVKEMIYSIRENVRIFSQDCSQSDDITMLAIKYNGPDETK